MGGRGEGDYKYSVGENLAGDITVLEREHVTGKDHIASAPTTYPVTQVGHTAKSIVVEKE
jgi:hypothetical protein